MKSIKGLEKHRWFIWTIVGIMVILGGLTIYVYYVVQTNDWGTSGTMIRQGLKTQKLQRMLKNSQTSHLKQY